MSDTKRKIPTIEEIQERTISQVRRDHGYSALDALIPNGAGEMPSHQLAQAPEGLITDVVTVPTDEQNRRLRLAVGHIAAALGIPVADLRQIHLTPHVITARAVTPTGTTDFVAGMVLR